jgi:hypothetical protein
MRLYETDTNSYVMNMYAQFIKKVVKQQASGC